MGIGGSIVVFTVAWWIAFQALLPVGVRNPAEAGVDLAGDPGAPVRPRLLLKALWASLIALAIWGGLFALVEWSGLDWADLPSIFDGN